jgi:hypothetical protein
MKKLLPLLLLLILSGAVWYNKHQIFFLLYEFRHRPKKTQFSEYPAGKVKIYYVPGAYLSAHISGIAESITRNLSTAQKTIGIPMKSALKVYVYNNWEEKGNDVRWIASAHCDPTENAVYYIVNEKIDGTREGLAYALLLQERYGPPVKPEWAHYVSAALSGVWNQKPLDEWAEFLLARNLQPEMPGFLLGDEIHSTFLIAPWNSIFARFVKEHYGWEPLIELYRTAHPPSGYEAPWKEYLAHLKHDQPPAYRFKPEFQKGVSYAFSNGYDSGYATEKSKQSLDQLKAAGVSWVAAIPYGFMRSHDSSKIYFSRSDIFSESDESMMALANDASKRGMKVMMKPQLWMHSSWTGRIGFENENAWNDWFDRYEQWIVHYAILSELMHADLLCIGTELVQATTDHPDRWRKIIARVREIYHGPLVYAANYGREFEEIRFWDSLDYIGLDNYYPVRISEDEPPAKMKEAFERQKEKIKQIVDRFQKPIVFTEIGYTAAKNSGMSSEADSSSGYNEELQKECYKLALETYWNEPWFSGMYWWKWFSDPTDHGTDADTFSPHGRPAEAIMKQWYTKDRR